MSDKGKDDLRWPEVLSPEVDALIKLTGGTSGVQAFKTVLDCLRQMPVEQQIEFVLFQTFIKNSLG